MTWGAQIDAKSSYKTIIVTCVIMSIVSIVVVGARLYLRRRSHCLEAYNCMSFSSLLFAAAYSSLCIIRTCPAKSCAPQSTFAGRPIYQVGISFFKIALLISYLRLLRGTDKRLYWLVVWDGNSTLLVVWGFIEFHVGTVVSSLPFLAPACLRCCRSHGPPRSGYESGFHSGGEGHGGGVDGDDRGTDGQGHFVRAEAAPTAKEGEARPRGSILVRESVSVHYSVEEKASVSKR
ncbi:hypothetical protein ARSEF4850_009959 [Beauveria asiatica]